MHDIREIREDPERFQRGLQRRGEEFDVQGLLELDAARRELTKELDKLRQERNSVSKQIGRSKRAGQDTFDLEAEMRRLGEELKAGEAREREQGAVLRGRLFEIPNMPADSIPDGMSESDNEEVRRWGEPPRFEFEPGDHLAVAERLGILDFKRGGKVTGSGFPVWSGAGAAIERALINFMLDLQTKEHGYREMMTPFAANRDSMLGSGQIPHLEDDMYLIEKDDLFLIPTSEVTLINLHRDEIIPESCLPLKYAAYSPCFRREAGAYGHTTRGFLRVHQFNKVELVRFERPDDSARALEEIVRHAEAVLQRLELHYRVVKLCAGELGFNASICYDLDVWAPAEGGRWLEVSSCSNCEDFQARRAGIRFRPGGGGKTEYVHILNGSGLATSRLMVALLETYQTDEGSLAIPPVLRPYLGGLTVVTATDEENWS